ncbi:MAG: ribosome-associated translation inhibitor RaiA [Candidatus Izemoplasmatales bacterium]|nr:ribosome-associated translation inhibitor RaiA [Candidatus Izemoplasmatales bacterium]MDD3865295.1 ribosome-associated translation inhibitor RaiA [Candidatus Izemoplasmatales bacterium]
MKLDVRGKNGLEITPAIRNYVEKKMRRIERMFSEDFEAFVVCKVYAEQTKVEITIPFKFITIRAEVEDKDLYAAIDLATDKLEAQIRKNKYKMSRSLQERTGIKEAFNQEEFNLEALERELISPVKKKRIALDILSTEEAITQMDLLGHDFFIYRNEDKEVCVMYLREDGKYGLIETQ